MTATLDELFNDTSVSAEDLQKAGAAQIIDLALDDPEQAEKAVVRIMARALEQLQQTATYADYQESVASLNVVALAEAWDVLDATLGMESLDDIREAIGEVTQIFDAAASGSGSMADAFGEYLASIERLSPTLWSVTEVTV